MLFTAAGSKEMLSYLWNRMCNDEVIVQNETRRRDPKLEVCMPYVTFRPCCCNRLFLISDWGFRRFGRVEVSWIGG